jgi:hypothetical protein
MLKQLSNKELEDVKGSLGIVDFYVDENGKLVKYSRPAGPNAGKRITPIKPFPFPRLSKP